jgi:hypothetical protein
LLIVATLSSFPPKGLVGLALLSYWNIISGSKSLSTISSTDSA